MRTFSTRDHQSWIRSSPIGVGDARAPARWSSGRVVAFPTESFYGLGADALDAGAVARVFEVKGRPDGKPLLVLVDSVEMVTRLATAVPDGARALMARHWPGALTLVLRASARVPAALTAGTGTVGVRMPGHAVARALVAAAARPVTAPSANPSAAAPPVTAAAVRGYFDGRVELILGRRADRGRHAHRRDCTVWPPRILRQGPVIVEAHAQTG
jgi:L-threonylcarbamoyladenylate synthase